MTLEVERHPFASPSCPRWILIAYDVIDGKQVNRRQVFGSPPQLQECVRFKLYLELLRWPTQEELDQEIACLQKKEK